MDGGGDAAALEHADEEAEAEVDDGEEGAMGHRKRHHHLMQAQSHPPPQGEGGHQHPTQISNTTTGTCASRVGTTSRYGTPVPRVTIANQGIRSVALGRMRSNTSQGVITSVQKERTG